MDDRIGLMKNLCRYPKCENKYYMPIYRADFRNKRFHAFPKNEKIASIWKAICNVDQNVRNASYFVCEDHFAPEDFANNTKQRLKPGVIPSRCPNITVSRRRYVDAENSDAPAIRVSQTTDKYSFLFDVKDESMVSTSLKTSMESRILTMLNIHNVITSKLFNLKEVLHREKFLIRKLFSFYEDGKFEYVIKQLKYVSNEFLMSYLEELPPLATLQWSNNDLYLALSLFIKNEKLYKYLGAFFPLPSAKKILANVIFKTGINDHIIASIEENVNAMNAENRTCVLIMAEMALTSGIQYDGTQQLLCGYEDMGHYGRSLKGADRVLVLMVRGLRKDWTQIVSYYFSCGPFKNTCLQSIITLVIKQLQTIRLNIVAVVCEQNHTSLDVLSLLCSKIDKQTNIFYFEINSQRICVIFSAPHLLRETHKVLTKCKILYDEELSRFAKFEHIECAYNLDQSKRIYKQLDNLKDQCFDTNTSMAETSLAVGIATFSHAVAASIETFVHSGDLPQAAMHTAEFVERMDLLFESLNGSTEQSEFKKFRGPLSLTSPHIQFWTTMLAQLNTWKLLDLKSDEDVSDCYCFIRGWQTTLESLIYTWNCLKDSFNYLSLNRFSLKPLEGLFDKIAKHGTNKISPTCYQFVAALKCELLNATDDLDTSDKCNHLNSQTSAETVYTGSMNSLKETYFDNLDFDKLLNLQFHEEAAYLSGYLIQKMDVPDCETCKSHLLAEWVLNVTELGPPKEKTYSLYASDCVIRLVDKILYHLRQFLKDQGNMSKLEDYFKGLYKQQLETFKFCTVHNTNEELVSLCIKLGIYRFIYCFNNKNNKIIINK